MKLNQKVYVIDAKRSAIGKFLGSLYQTDAADVCSQVIRKGFAGYRLEDVEVVILGNVISAGLGQGIARHIAIAAGIPEHVPSYTVGMVCGSGMQAIINGVLEITGGNRNLVLCGGFELMSNIPYATKGHLRTGQKYGDYTMTDLMIHDGLTDAFSGVHMGITAENIASSLDISRAEQDRYAMQAQLRAIHAVDSGIFRDEIIPLELKDYRHRPYVFDTDEFINRTSTIEKLSSLKPSFLHDGSGTVTAGNASGINDGAAFLLLAGEEYCVKHNLQPIAEIIAFSTIGCDPQKMGLGPYYAIKNLLTESGLHLSDIPRLEINEAFAAQLLGCLKLLSRDCDIPMADLEAKCNVYGSGLGLGHPLGMTGARIVTTLAWMLKRHEIPCGIASLCIGGGMGAAMLLKEVQN